MKATSSAPGKIILSGEHAAVYGKPALITAVASYVRCHVAPNPANDLLFQSESFEPLAVTADALRERHRAALMKLEEFDAGKIQIIDVLSRDNDLLSLSWSELDAAYPNRLSTNTALQISSELPAGCGMGSSAAVCAAALSALAAASELNVQEDELYERCLRLERFQHGTPSGADPYIAVHGGCVLFEKGRSAITIGVPAVPLYIVQTGRPDSTTGEAVAEVRRTHGKSRIWDQFASTSKAIAESASTGDIPESVRLMRENHRLLVEIGVVPEQVQEFVHEIESAGGAAKISGAGSVRGDAAGAVLVCAEQAPESLCSRYGYALTHIKGESRGVHVLDPG